MTEPATAEPPVLIEHGTERAIPLTLVPLPDRNIDLRTQVERYESQLILQALARTGGNKNRAAQLLGLKRTTLVEKIKRKGL